MSKTVEEVITELEEAMKSKNAYYPLPEDAPPEIENYLKQIGFWVVKIGNTNMIFWK